LNVVTHQKLNDLEDLTVERHDFRTAAVAVATGRELDGMRTANPASLIAG
jgi:hypothetical protein